MYKVSVDEPNPAFAKMLLEQFGGPNGELAAAMRYFTQGWNEPDEQRRSMMLDIATEELSHLEMVAQTLHMLLKGSPSELVDQVEGNYLGDMLNGQMPDYVNMSLNSGPNILGGGGPRLTDSMGSPWTAAYIDTIGQPAADLRSDIAAEARAKITYERLIKFTDDAGVKDTLTFLMTREVATRRCSKRRSTRSRRTSRPAHSPATRSSDMPTSPTPATSVPPARIPDPTPPGSTWPRTTATGASNSTPNPSSTPRNRRRNNPGPGAACRAGVSGGAQVLLGIEGEDLQVRCGRPQQVSPSTSALRPKSLPDIR
jgi:rubrerythrin